MLSNFERERQVKSSERITWDSIKMGKVGLDKFFCGNLEFIHWNPRAVETENLSNAILVQYFEPNPYSAADINDACWAE